MGSHMHEFLDYSNSTITENNIKVSVLILCFNHENFILEAVNSALMQIVDFNFEIVIGDDGSVDSTRKILLDIHKGYPNKIILLFQNRNVGSKKNQIDAI